MFAVPLLEAFEQAPEAIPVVTDGGQGARVDFETVELDYCLRDPGVIGHANGA